jgi:hypothetical protein
MAAPSANTKWQLYNVSGDSTIQLPLYPQKLVYEAAADIKEVSFPTKNNSLLISLGKKINKLTLTGVLAEAAGTAESLYDSYITGLFGMVRLKVQIVMPSGTDRYNGTWILNRFQYEETGGYTTSYKYTLEFIQGTDGSNTAPGIVI